MTINTILNEGLNGIRQSQQEMLKAANEIARAGTTANPGSVAEIEGNSSPTSIESSEGVRDNTGGGAGLVEPLIDLRIQQRVFDASARIVRTADETLGTLLDTKA
ncbi:hypothetical protein FKG94_19505 [Exilibacterium tricleocarpae]|uniref:Flagellar biosynthesis protein FlgE n=1 Tax=Exilibacterium tricleocarpae TaxID=2591008 RepID=A0A545T3N8_9GAMM|nr:hypothetical protein [Exilibacterium tricleocarpae]TQV71832.1 hypothetical protein FKG94_19505 [Exilibacterium tricleocarpae]